MRRSKFNINYSRNLYCFVMLKCWTTMELFPNSFQCSIAYTCIIFGVLLLLWCKFSPLKTMIISSHTQLITNLFDIVVFPWLKDIFTMPSKLFSLGLIRRSTVTYFYLRYREITSHAQLSFQEQLSWMSKMVKVLNLIRLLHM